MRAIKLFINAVIFFAIALLGALFTLRNKQLLSVDFIFIQGPEVSLGLWLTLFLMIGAILGILFSSLVVGSKLRQIRRSKQRDE